ncbi:MAG: 4-alpha-glucanotransferase [Deltaproteobacteria bacterium]|nr:MAG: 4-alpha-glucanotransferase [Deltaproteobacteria bacterium]
MEPLSLHALADRLGVLTRYTDLRGEPTPATEGALRAVLDALGVDPADPPPAERIDWPPVQVRWLPQPAPIQAPPGVQTLELIPEAGQHVTLHVHEGRVALPADLPPGRHAIWAGERRSVLILAPSTCWTPDQDPRALGLFLPHHALHTANTRGLGDFTALAELGRWAASQGVKVLATLPLLPTFLHADAPYEPSPYAPVSRLFWGEHLIDPRATPEWSSCEAARVLLAEAERDGTLADLRRSDRVDPKGAWALQRRLLAALASTAWREPSTAQTLTAWADEDPRRRAYAQFRAATEANGPWPTWERARHPSGAPGVPYHADAERLWIYAQYQATAQILALRDALAESKISLYLDLPIGVHPDSFDVWYWGDRVFARDASAGAPPDPYFPSGQDWGFPPIDPHRSTREDGHDYVLSCLRAHARVAHLLRLDHVMGFYRLYWVPRGFGAKQGVYVRYPAEAWWAALCVASHEGGCAVVGENLGMVPPEVDQTLAQLHVRGMAVGQFHLTHDPQHPLRPIPPGVVASLNTHDTPTFAGWWQAEDLDTHAQLGWLSPERVAQERRGRAMQRQAVAGFATYGGLLGEASAPEKVAAGLYRALAESPAHLVLVNLEDLWGEVRPHNVPGTWRERPNWLRRSALSLEEICDHPHAGPLLTRLAGRL